MKPFMVLTSAPHFASNPSNAFCMKTIISRRHLNRKATCLIGLACLAVPAALAADNATKKEESTDPSELRNWIDVSVGGNFVHGDKPAFQQRTGQPRDAW